MPTRSDAAASPANSSHDSSAPARRPPAWVWVALVVLAGAAAVYRSDANDYWFHLAAGRSIVQHGLPAHETWCLAARGQAPWLSEWLFHVALYRVHQLGGDLGVALWRAAWTAGAMALAVQLLGVLGAASWTAVFLTPLLLAVSRDRFQPRPEQIFLVLVLFALVQLERARRAAPDRTRWLIPAQALWANLHGSWVFGPAIAWIYAAAEAWQPRSTPAVAGDAAPARPASRFARARLWAALGLVMWGASALVPRPLETLALPFRFLGDVAADPLTGSIEELRRWAWPQDRYQPFTAWLPLCTIAALVGGRRLWRASPGLSVFALGALALGFLGFRFRGLAAWAAFVPLAVALTPGRPSWLGRLRALPAVAAGLAGAGWLLAAPQFTPGIEPQWYSVPVRAVALADSAGLEGPVLNTFHYGGYILWVRGEQHPPVIDGRGRGSLQFRRLFAEAYGSPVALDSLLEAWRFTHAILEPPRSSDDRLATNLGRRLEWALVSYDDNGCLFVPWSRYPRLARERAFRYFTPDYLAMTEMSQRSLADRGLGRLLEAELQRARAQSPFHARASMWLGLLALGRGDGKRAVAYLEEAERIAPATPGLALRQGLAYELVGDRTKARRAYRRALKEPDDAIEAGALLESVQP